MRHVIDFFVIEHDIIVSWSEARDPTKVNNKAWKNELDFELEGSINAYQWILGSIKF